MADEQYLLEDLEDEGEEVDYDDFNLDDEDFDEAALGDEDLEADGNNGEELTFDDQPPDFEDGSLKGTAAGTSARAQPAKKLDTTPEPEQGNSTENVEDTNKQPSTAGGRTPIPAPTSGKGQEGSTAAAKPKTEARGGAASQRGRQGPRSGRGQQDRGPQGIGVHNGRQMPQPHSRGPTPPPIPNGMGMPRPGPGMPGLPMPPGMLLPGQMMGARPMQMMPRPIPMAAGQPRPPPGRGPAPPLHSQERQRGGRHAPIPAPQPPPREPVRWQEPPGSRAPPQMGGDAGQRRMQGGPDHPAGPAGLPMPPNMTHLMFQGPHPQAPPPGGFGGRQDQRSPGVSQPPNGNVARPAPPAAGRRGGAGDFNLALGMDASASVRNGGGLGAKPHVSVPQRLQGRLEDPAPLLGLLRPRDMAEELRQKEERQEAERAKARASKAQEKKKAEELKAKRLEMAKLQIALQRAENVRNQQLLAGVVAADERLRKQREAEEFEAMKARVMQLEKLVAAAAAPPASAPVAAPKAAASAPSVAPAEPAPKAQPQKEEEAAGADPGLQVDFDEDEEDDNAAQAAPQQPARLPIAARLGSKEVKTVPHSRSIRSQVSSQVRIDQIERPIKEKRRPQRSSPAAEDMDADEASPREGFTDLREFLSRKKRTREEGTADDSRPRAQAKAAAGLRTSGHR